jgi:hypothetical protein
LETRLKLRVTKADLGRLSEHRLLLGPADAEPVDH